MPLSYSNEKKVSKASSRWFYGKLSQACCLSLWGGFFPHFRETKKSSEWVPRQIFFLLESAVRDQFGLSVVVLTLLAVKAKDFAVNGHLEGEASSGISEPLFRCCLCIWSFWKSFLKEVLCNEGRWLCKSKDGFLVPPFNSWQGCLSSSDSSY